MTSVLTLDGTAYPNLHVTSLKRSFAVLDGDNAGRVMTGAMVRDIIGTFYNYQFTVDPKSASPEVYDAFYQVISSPEDSHTIVVPYGQGTMTFDAYITTGDDELVLIGDDANRWKNLSFSVIAMSPQRLPS